MREIYLCKLCESSASRINLYRINFYHAILAMHKMLEHISTNLLKACFDKFAYICHTHKNVA